MQVLPGDRERDRAKNLGLTRLVEEFDRFLEASGDASQLVVQVTNAVDRDLDAA